MPLEVISELAKVGNIVGIKEASGSVDNVSHILEETAGGDFAVLSGEDSLTFPIVALGGAGVISVVANLVPEMMVQMVDAAKKGDLATAQALHYKMAPLIRVLFSETNPIPVKRAVELMGFASGDMRLPLASISKENEIVLTDILRNMGCIA